MTGPPAPTASSRVWSNLCGLIAVSSFFNTWLDAYEGMQVWRGREGGSLEWQRRHLCGRWLAGLGGGGLAGEEKMCIWEGGGEGVPLKLMPQH